MGRDRLRCRPLSRGGGLDLLERVLIGSIVVCVALAALVLATGWRADVAGWANAIGDLRPGAQLARGQGLYNTYCATCHGGPEAPPPGLVYPPRHNATGHTFEHPDCELVTIVLDGSNARTRALRAREAPPGSVEMPAFGQRLTRADVAAIVAYIKTMWTPDQVRSQEQVTRDQCSAG